MEPAVSIAAALQIECSCHVTFYWLSNAFSATQVHSSQEANQNRLAVAPLSHRAFFNLILLHISCFEQYYSTSFNSPVLQFNERFWSKYAVLVNGTLCDSLVSLKERN